VAKVNSKKLFERAQQVMVGGVNSPVRSFLSVGGNPLIAHAGTGAKVSDVDGNSYTDYCLSWGALILGHAHRDVVSAAQKAVGRGASFGITTKPEIEIANFIVKNVPSIDMVRFVNSGTEATMSAIRLARGFTKKNIVVKFDGCYHGHFDDLLIKAGSGVANLKESSSLGITSGHVQNTISLPYNDTTLLAQTLESHKNDIACVMIEPVAGNMGTIEAKKDFLSTLRNLTRKYNIVLIFDEIMSGFRTDIGCVQNELGIIPDITCLGKIIGGGFPVGAYGGRKDIMKHLSPLGGVYQAGTFSGTPVVMSAGLATLKNLTHSFYAQLNKKSQQFAGGINSYFKENNLPCFLQSYKSMVSIRFQGAAVLNYAQAIESSSKELYGKLFWHLLENGIYWPPAELETFFVSGAHTTKDLAFLAQAIKKFFNEKKA